MKRTNDMPAWLERKTDQMNAQDIEAIGGVYGVITKAVEKNSKEQPIEIFIDGYDLPWRPCLSMRHVLAQAWGRNLNDFVGKTVSLYCDPTVSFGAAKNIGGIRINGLSDFPDGKIFVITISRGQKKQWPVKLLQPAKPAQQSPQAQQQQAQNVQHEYVSDEQVKRLKTLVSGFCGENGLDNQQTEKMQELYKQNIIAFYAKNGVKIGSTKQIIARHYDDLSNPERIQKICGELLAQV